MTAHEMHETSFVRNWSIRATVALPNARNARVPFRGRAFVHRSGHPVWLP